MREHKFILHNIIHVFDTIEKMELGIENMNMYCSIKSLNDEKWFLKIRVSTKKLEVNGN